MPFGTASTASRYSAKSGPCPRQSRRHRLRGDVLRPFQVAHHQSPGVRSRRGQSESAVTHHHARDSMPAAWLAHVIPKHLRIHVGMRIDETGRDNQPGGVDFLTSLTIDLPHRHDPVSGHRHIASKPRGAGAIHNPSAPNNQIEIPSIHVHAHKLLTRSTRWWPARPRHGGRGGIPHHGAYWRPCDLPAAPHLKEARRDHRPHPGVSPLLGLPWPAEHTANRPREHLLLV